MMKTTNMALVSSENILDVFLQQFGSFALLVKKTGIATYKLSLYCYKPDIVYSIHYGMIFM